MMERKKVNTADTLWLWAHIECNLNQLVNTLNNNYTNKLCVPHKQSRKSQIHHHEQYGVPKLLFIRDILE